MVTVYFSDIVGFTKISSKMSSSKVSDMLDRLYTKFDALADEYGFFKLETIGDGRPAGSSSRSAHGHRLKNMNRNLSTGADDSLLLYTSIPLARSLP